MKKYRIRYKDSYFAKKDKYLDVIAETSQDAANYFFDNYSGMIFEIEFIDWA